MNEISYFKSYIGVSTIHISLLDAFCSSVFFVLFSDDDKISLSAYGSCLRCICLS